MGNLTDSVLIRTLLTTTGEQDTPNRNNPQKSKALELHLLQRRREIVRSKSNYRLS